jgi:hypothetical protein
MSLKFVTIQYDILNYENINRLETLVVSVDDAEILGKQQQRTEIAVSNELNDTEEVYVRIEDNVYAKAGATLSDWYGWLGRSAPMSEGTSSTEITVTDGEYYTQLAGTLIEQIILRPEAGAPDVRLGSAAGLDDIMFDTPTAGGSAVISLDRYRDVANRIYFGITGGATVKVYVLSRQIV